VRSMKIAEFITSSVPGSSCRILAGNGIVERSLPRNTDVVALPQILKSVDGTYLLRSCDEHPFISDPASIKKAFAVRRQIIDSTIDLYAPDIFLVDDLTGEICTKWNERESTWRKHGSCPSRGTSQSKS